MQGKYQGFYKFNSTRIEQLRGVKKTFFYCTIDFFDGKKFSGTIEDDSDSGGMIGIGRIEGELKNGKISFVKRMPVRMVIKHEPIQLEVSPEPHPPIYYKGKLSSDKRYFHGTWAFNPFVMFLYGMLLGLYMFIGLSKTPRGTWEMHPIESER